MTNKTKIFINLPSIDESVCNVSVEFNHESKHKITATMRLSENLHNQLREEVRTKYGTADNLHESCVAAIGNVMGPAELFRAAFDVALTRLYAVKIIRDWYDKLFNTVFSDISIPVHKQLGVPARNITKEVAANSSNMVFAFVPVFVADITQAPELLKSMPKSIQQTAVTFLSSDHHTLVTVSANTVDYSSKPLDVMSEDESRFLTEAAKECICRISHAPTISELHSIVVPQVSQMYLEGEFDGQGFVLEEHCNAALRIANKFHGLPELLKTYTQPKPKNMLN
jgi:hypothetical protein